MYQGKDGGFRLPIRGKLFLFFLLVIILPLLLFGSLLFSRQVQVLEEELASASQRELVQLAERVNLEFVQLRSISNMIYLDDTVAQLLRRFRSGEGDVETTEALSREMSQRMHLYSAGSNNIRFQVAIVDEEGAVWGSAGSSHSPDQFSLSTEGSVWRKRLEQRPSDILWVRDPALDSLFFAGSTPQVYLVRKLHDRTDWSPLGTLVIGVSQADIQKMYYGYVGWDQSCYLVDRDGQTVSSVDNLELGSLDGALPADLTAFSGSRTQGQGRERLLVNHHTISDTQWKILSLTTLETRFSRFTGVIQLYFLILSLYLLITLLLSGIMANRFSRPIINLYASILRVKEGDLSVQVPVVSRDEVGEVAAQFNGMLEQIRQLMARNLREQKLKRDAEILSLQTQINPHFLYNTLASIRYLVFAGDKQTADTAILSLIRLMKNTLSDANEFVTVESELALLGEYISLQQLAIRQPIEVELTAAAEVKSCKTMKLLLQPIVENAFLHGLKPKGSDMALRVLCREEADCLVFQVQDNGVGFDPEAVTYTDKDLKKRSIGLSNVRSRIALTFGEGYGVDIASRPGAGTTVTLRIPIIRNRGEYSSYEHISGG